MMLNLNWHKKVLLHGAGEVSYDFHESYAVFGN